MCAFSLYFVLYCTKCVCAVVTDLFLLNLTLKLYMQCDSQLSHCMLLSFCVFRAESIPTPQYLPVARQALRPAPQSDQEHVCGSCVRSGVFSPVMGRISSAIHQSVERAIVREKARGKGCMHRSDVVFVSQKVPLLVKLKGGGGVRGWGVFSLLQTNCLFIRQGSLTLFIFCLRG